VGVGGQPHAPAALPPEKRPGTIVLDAGVWTYFIVTSISPTDLQESLCTVLVLASPYQNHTHHKLCYSTLMVETAGPFKTFHFI